MNQASQRFEDRSALRAGTMSALAVLAQSERRGRRRPRSSEEREMLLRMAIFAARERARSGRLEVIGPREYRLHPVVMEAELRDK